MEKNSNWCTAFTTYPIAAEQLHTTSNRNVLAFYCNLYLVSYSARYLEDLGFERCDDSVLNTTRHSINCQLFSSARGGREKQTQYVINQLRKSETQKFIHYPTRRCGRHHGRNKGKCHFCLFARKHTLHDGNTEVWSFSTPDYSRSIVAQFNFITCVWYPKFYIEIRRQWMKKSILACLLISA